MVVQPADQSPELTRLERTVLEAALSAAGIDAGLREQIDVATVRGRTPSGVGFMTRLHVPERYSVGHGGVIVPVVNGAHPALPAGAEFVLQVKNGRINSIEAFCHEGMWPDDEDRFEIRPAHNGSAA